MLWRRFVPACLLVTIPPCFLTIVLVAPPLCFVTVTNLGLHVCSHSVRECWTRNHAMVTTAVPTHLLLQPSLDVVILPPFVQVVE